MADRYPLIYNPSANQIQELQSGDSLDLGNAALKNVSNFSVSGILTAVGFTTAGGTSSQFLKADGSVDSTTYVTQNTYSETSTLQDVLLRGNSSTQIMTVGEINATSASITNQISAGSVSAGSISVTGNISVGGTITYEDVTNVDSIGIVTARSGVDINGGGLNVDAGGVNVTGVSTFANDVKVGSGITMYANSGIVSATAYYGDGSNLTGVAAAGSGGGALDITSCLFI